jgi:hypothetical protein
MSEPISARTGDRESVHPVYRLESVQQLGVFREGRHGLALRLGLPNLDPVRVVEEPLEPTAGAIVQLDRRRALAISSGFALRRV